MQNFNNPTRHQQHGIGLLEALVALLVLSLGMLTVARVQSHLRLGSDIARQRAEAVRLGQEDLETSRAFSVLAASGAARSYAGITSASTRVAPSTGYASNTRYTVSRQITAASALATKHATVGVSWADRNGDAQRIELNTIIAANDPAYGGMFAIAPTGVPAKGAFARSPRVPLLAKDLGNGTSVLKPTSASAVAFVFDNVSGRVTARCSGINPSATTHDLGPGQLTSCATIDGHLLSGGVRFSQASFPDAACGNDTPLALNIALALSGGSYAVAPECSSEAIQTNAGNRYVAYQCVVVPLANGRWSGRSTIAAIGLDDRQRGERPPCLPLFGRSRRQRRGRCQRRAPGQLQRRRSLAREPELPRRQGHRELPRRQQHECLRQPEHHRAPTLTR